MLITNLHKLLLTLLCNSKIGVSLLHIIFMVKIRSGFKVPGDNQQENIELLVNILFSMIMFML